MSYLVLATLTQVVGEIVADVRGKHVGIFRVKFQHLSQSPQADILKVTVGQGLYISIGFDHLVCPRQIRSNQIPFP